MSVIFGDINSVRAGLITFMPEGKGERPFDAILTDVIEQGALCFNDYTNATANLRKYKKTGTGGLEVGEFIVCTKAKINGVAKVVGVGKGFRVLVVADGNIDPGADVKPSTGTAGRVMQWAGPTDGTNVQRLNVKVGRYTKLAKKAYSNDGNTALVQAVQGDIIEIEIY